MIFLGWIEIWVCHSNLLFGATSSVAFLKGCFVPQPWFNYGCFGDFTLHFNCQFSFQKQWQRYRHIWGRVDGVPGSASIWCRGALLGCGRRQYMSLVISPIPSLGNCWVRLARSQNVWVCWKFGPGPWVLENRKVYARTKINSLFPKICWTRPNLQHIYCFTGTNSTNHGFLQWLSKELVASWTMPRARSAAVNWLMFRSWFYRFTHHKCEIC